MFKEKISLSKRLENILALAIVFVVVFSLPSFFIQEAATRKAMIQQEIESWLKIVSPNLEAHARLNRPESANELIAKSFGHLNVVALIFVKEEANGNAKIFTEKYESGSPPLSLMDLYQEAETPKSFFTKELLAKASHTASKGEEVKIMAYAKVNLMPMWGDLSVMMLKLALLLLVSGVIATLFARRMLRNALQPLAELKNLTENISHTQQFSLRAQIHQQDEVGLLANSFNQMLGQIEERDNKLERNRELLVCLKNKSDAASQAKSNFLANMSHEVRAPINAIVLLSNKLLDGEQHLGQEKKLDYLKQIKSASNMLLALVRDILDFSKIEAGRIELEKKDFSLFKLLHEIDVCCGEKARDQGLTFLIHYAENVPEFVCGDQLRLSQILLNLVGNAVKFTHQGYVRVDVDNISDQTIPEEIKLRFTIRDTGIGIENNKQDRLFNIFEQANPETYRKYGGTGLGLSISKQLVQLMGGEIALESQQQNGTTFWFNIALAPSSTLEPALIHHKDSLPDIDPRRNEALRGLRILVVDDEPLNHLVATELLADIGCEVISAYNGREALALLYEQKFDFIFMDMQIPEMNGVEITHLIRCQPTCRDIVIIAMTGNEGEKEKQQCLAAGMNAFLTKPIDPQQLYTLLLHHISSASRH